MPCKQQQQKAKLVMLMHPRNVVGKRIHIWKCLYYLYKHPLQCSCLENPRDGGAWWVAVYGSRRVGHNWSDAAAAAAAAEWSSGFPYFLQFQSEFGNKEFRIWATVSSRSCFCWLYRASPSLAAKNITSCGCDWW